MATYEVRIKGIVHIKHSNGTGSTIKVDEIVETNDLSHAQSLKQKKALEHWAKNKYFGADYVSLTSTFKSIKEEKSRKQKEEKSSSGGSWGIFSIFKPIWWIIKFIIWIFRLFK